MRYSQSACLYFRPVEIYASTIRHKVQKAIRPCGNISKVDVYKRTKKLFCIESIEKRQSNTNGPQQATDKLQELQKQE